MSGVRPDQVSAGWAARLARGIAPIRDAGGEQEAAGVPESARLLDVLRLEPPAPGQIIARWQEGGPATVAVAGESADAPFRIDLRRDGPHGLVAGTAGSGKSELLQTIIASLAVANRPDAMTFVLIDYQGGSAFGDCVRLPHTVGMMTDLDAHLAERALTSLTAELTRREHLLAVAGATDIDDYLAARILGVAASLPRLVLVVDEFAALARDLPDFVTGLVSIAERGRSLGLHLILATQRPSVMVSADIRASTNLRIALRVTDPAESARVIDAPDAARISPHLPGRGYARVGAGPLVPFQVARVSGRRPVTPGAAGPAGRPAEQPWVARLDWADLGRPPLTRPPGQPADGEVGGLVGVGGDELTGYGPDLSRGVSAFAVVGPRRSGRSTALVAMARSLLAAGARIVLVTPRPSPLRRLAGQAGVAASIDPAGLGDGALAALAAVTGPAVVVVDDAELLGDGAAGDELSELISLGGGLQRALVFAGTASDLGAALLADLAARPHGAECAR
jgi:DNA translocase FtsK/SpoIIIE-like protein